MFFLADMLNKKLHLPKPGEALPGRDRPVPTAAEAYLRRGRDLFDSGRLRDALAEYDRVPAGDPLRVSADEMRAHIQRELLSLALAETSSAAPSAGASVPPPE